MSVFVSNSLHLGNACIRTSTTDMREMWMETAYNLEQGDTLLIH